MLSSHHFTLLNVLPYLLGTTNTSTNAKNKHRGEPHTPSGAAEGAQPAAPGKLQAQPSPMRAGKQAGHGQGSKQRDNAKSRDALRCVQPV